MTNEVEVDPKIEALAKYLDRLDSEPAVIPLSVFKKYIPLYSARAIGDILTACKGDAAAYKSAGELKKLSEEFHTLHANMYREISIVDDSTPERREIQRLPPLFTPVENIANTSYNNRLSAELTQAAAQGGHRAKEAAELSAKYGEALAEANLDKNNLVRLKSAKVRAERLCDNFEQNREGDIAPKNKEDNIASSSLLDNAEWDDV